MIDEKQIQEAIAYYGGKTDPKREDAIALAACYIIQDRMNRPEELPQYSFAPPPTENQAMNAADAETVGDYGDSDFLQSVRGMDASEAWAIMDDLMDTIAMINRRIYDGVMRELKK